MLFSSYYPAVHTIYQHLLSLMFSYLSPSPNNIFHLIQSRPRDFPFLCLSIVSPASSLLMILIQVPSEILFAQHPSCTIISPPLCFFPLCVQLPLQIFSPFSLKLVLPQNYETNKQVFIPILPRHLPALFILLMEFLSYCEN